MHCPECGFANAEGANYCQKCGAFLGDQTEKKSGGDTTEVYQVDETGELRPVDLDTMTHEGATLVIRSGGGRAGEAFHLSGERNTIGRSPDAEVFLDDVTVSRNHALLVRIGLRHGMDISVNWPGRLAVWPVMSAIFAALVELEDAAPVLLYIGLALAMLSLAMYVRDGIVFARTRQRST